MSKAKLKLVLQAVPRAFNSTLVLGWLFGVVFFGAIAVLADTLKHALRCAI